ncbi:hypothetical protein [Alienimonas chondri]|uniref:Lipoprotein n=1 Tax=Alienimonas chondri TaxID=2681879 RepID=A0ABX1VD35_9PLAN|nr:hypothetical protein [Alienimonas chondri]NNJ25698.1 hypothetical protein [Alienimonas chondri]
MSRSPHRTAWLGAASICVASCLGSVGCAVSDMAEEAWFQTKRTLTPSSEGYLDPTENVADDWGEVREFGRPDQELVEDDPDWYRKYFMSAKARDIEGNLGYD